MQNDQANHCHQAISFHIRDNILPSFLLFQLQFSYTGKLDAFYVEVNAFYTLPSAQRAWRSFLQELVWIWSMGRPEIIMGDKSIKFELRAIENDFLYIVVVVVCTILCFENIV